MNCYTFVFFCSSEGCRYGCSVKVVGGGILWEVTGAGVHEPDVRVLLNEASSCRTVH